VSKQQADATAIAAVVSAEEAEVAARAAQTQALKDEAQADLAAALPALEAAVKVGGCRSCGILCRRLPCKLYAVWLCRLSHVRFVTPPGQAARSLTRSGLPPALPHQHRPSTP
jgi:hypothetical protein